MTAEPIAPAGLRAPPAALSTALGGRGARSLVDCTGFVTHPADAPPLRAALLAASAGGVQPALTLVVAQGLGRGVRVALHCVGDARARQRALPERKQMRRQRQLTLEEGMQRCFSMRGTPAGARGHAAGGVEGVEGTEGEGQIGRGTEMEVLDLQVSSSND